MKCRANKLRPNFHSYITTKKKAPINTGIQPPSKNFKALARKNGISNDKNKISTDQDAHGFHFQ